MDTVIIHFLRSGLAANPVRNSRTSKLIRQGKISNGANDKLPKKPPGRFFPLQVKDHRSTDSFKLGQPIVGTTYFYWYDTFTLMWMTHSLMNCSAGRSRPVRGPPLAGTQTRRLFYELSTNNAIFRQNLTILGNLSKRLVHKSAGRYSFGIRFAAADITSLSQTTYDPQSLILDWSGRRR